MANNNTYIWQFPALEVTKQQGDYTDVVYTIHWRLNGADQTASPTEQSRPTISLN